LFIVILWHIGSEAVSETEFRNAVASAGYGVLPRPDQIANFNRISGQFGITKTHGAMLLANSLLETGGLQEMMERKCQTDLASCKKDYYCKDVTGPDCGGNNCGQPNTIYYGRGYLQLTWCYNYKPASVDLGVPQMVNDPDIVSRDQNLAWNTAGWFWNKRVLGYYEQRLANEVRQGMFGSSIKIINGGKECPPENNEFRAARQKRILNYIAVYKAFNLPGQPNTDGCAG
jgi:predicted chitinase